MKIKVIIAMHKPYEIPEDELYLPLHVGAKGKEPIHTPMGTPISGDDTGDEISHKNPGYCELTGLYWAWKNLDADAIGLVHYRRYFRGKTKGTSKMQQVLTQGEARELLAEHDIIVPSKRKYYIETLYSHYGHTHDAKHLDITREIIAEKYPNYLPACVAAYTCTWGYMFNMCFMQKKYLDEYCRWLFDILAELEERLQASGDTENLSAFDARLYGRVSEILFNVWIRYMKDGEVAPKIVEVPTMHMESINWWKKGTSFLKAKFSGKKYSKSF